MDESNINTLSLRYKLGFLHYSTVIEAANAGNEIALVNHKIICKYKEKEAYNDIFHVS